MKSNPRKVEPPQFLTGWKEIANYLGKGVRTVQRYERHLGLPVRRPAAKDRGSVVATKSEIDAWVQASPIRETFRLTRSEPYVSAKAAADIRQGVSQMTALREQMTALRADLRDSVQLLHEKVVGLEMNIRPHEWHNFGPITLIPTKDRETFLQLLRIYSERKAS
jgi:hypothetical protein